MAEHGADGTGGCQGWRACAPPEGLVLDSRTARRHTDSKGQPLTSITDALPAPMELVASLAKRGEREQTSEVLMIGRLNHVAIAVPALGPAAAVYRNALGAQVSEPLAQPEHGVTVVFVTLPNTKIEFLEPLGDTSPIASFLQRNPSGGMHHVCYEVDDIVAARDRLKAAGARVLGDGEPKIGAHGKPVLFLHPKDFCGTLVEIEQA